MILQFMPFSLKVLNLDIVSKACTVQMLLTLCTGGGVVSDCHIT